MSETTDSFREYVNRNKEIEDSDFETQIIKILYHIDEGNNLSDIAIDSIDSSYDVGCSEARYQRVVDRINLLMSNIDLGSMKWFEVTNGLTATQITELRAAGISIG